MASETRIEDHQQTDQTQAEDAIQIEDLRVVRGGHEVLHGISLSVPRGSVTGLLGPSGCGKTTLMRAIVGVQIVAGGTVRVLGLPAGAPQLRSRVSRHARERVGYVTQAPSVYGDLTVGENLSYFAAIVEASPERVAEVLHAVGLAGREDQLTATLSGGQRARVSLASALLGRPELLVLDEPTVGLDPVLRAELWKTFHGLAAEGTTLLVSSHVMDEAAECDRLLLMRDGSLLDQTTPQALRDRTGEDDLGRAFLAVIKSAEATR
jgi:ABC-2 type transport system ATP-binding protein